MATYQSGVSCRRLSAVLDYITDHYADEISLDDLARASGISKFNLCRQFARIQGITPMRWLWIFRAQLSAELLASPVSWSIQEVAYSCGFSCPAHFTRAFKEIFGLTPSDYRKRESAQTKGRAARGREILKNRDCVLVKRALERTRTQISGDRECYLLN